VLNRNRKVVLCGVGRGRWWHFLAYYRLKIRGIHISLMVGTAFLISPRSRANLI